MRLAGIALAVMFALPTLSASAQQQQQQQHQQHQQHHGQQTGSHQHGTTTTTHTTTMHIYHARGYTTSGHATGATVYHASQVHSTTWVRGVTSYHMSRYHVSVNVTYVSSPRSYPSAHWAYYNGHRWWDGYWYNYWADQNWIWWNGEYGFWLSYGGINLFVYEYAPGDCNYWNGNAWVPWYDPPYTPYSCPY